MPTDRLRRLFRDLANNDEPPSETVQEFDSTIQDEEVRRFLNDELTALAPYISTGAECTDILVSRVIESARADIRNIHEFRHELVGVEQFLVHHLYKATDIAYKATRILLGYLLRENEKGNFGCEVFWTFVDKRIGHIESLIGLFPCVLRFPFDGLQQAQRLLSLPSLEAAECLYHWCWRSILDGGDYFRRFSEANVPHGENERNC